jgi:hypothetical protein
MSLFFPFSKSENKRVEQVLSGGSGLVPVGGEDVEEGCKRLNIVQVLCTHVCKWKNYTC